MNNYIFKIIYRIEFCSLNNTVRAMIPQSWEKKTRRKEGNREEREKRDNSFRANNVRAVQTEIQTNSNCPINFQLRMKYADDSWAGGVLVRLDGQCVYGEKGRNGWKTRAIVVDTKWVGIV